MLSSFIFQLSLGIVALQAITGTSMPVPYRLVKSLHLFRRSGTGSFSLSYLLTYHWRETPNFVEDDIYLHLPVHVMAFISLCISEPVSPHANSVLFNIMRVLR